MTQYYFSVSCFIYRLSVHLLLSVAAIVFTKHCSLSGVHVVDVSPYGVYFSIVGQISEIFRKHKELNVYVHSTISLILGGIKICQDNLTSDWVSYNILLLNMSARFSNKNVILVMCCLSQSNIPLEHDNSTQEIWGVRNSQ